jgi:hypothetical protein
MRAYRATRIVALTANDAQLLDWSDISISPNSELGNADAMNDRGHYDEARADVHGDCDKVAEAVE